MCPHRASRRERYPSPGNEGPDVGDAFLFRPEGQHPPTPPHSYPSHPHYRPGGEAHHVLRSTWYTSPRSRLRTIALFSTKHQNKPHQLARPREPCKRRTCSKGRRVGGWGRSVGGLGGAVPPAGGREYVKTLLNCDKSSYSRPPLSPSPPLGRVACEKEGRVKRRPRNRGGRRRFGGPASRKHHFFLPVFKIFFGKTLRPLRSGILAEEFFCHLLKQRND